MKKIVSALLLVLLSVTPLFSGDKGISAAYYDYFSEEEPSVHNLEGSSLNENEGNSDGSVTIQCSGGYPTGWSSVRSGSIHIRTTTKGTKIYHRYGGNSQASYDFYKTVAPGISYRKYVNVDGSVTLIKNPSQGLVRYYNSKESYPTLNFGNEKIRYK